MLNQHVHMCAYVCVCVHSTSQSVYCLILNSIVLPTQKGCGGLEQYPACTYEEGQTEEEWGVGCQSSPRLLCYVQLIITRTAQCTISITLRVKHLKVR